MHLFPLDGKIIVKIFPCNGNYLYFSFINMNKMEYMTIEYLDREVGVSYTHDPRSATRLQPAEENLEIHEMTYNGRNVTRLICQSEVYDILQEEIGRL